MLMMEERKTSVLRVLTDISEAKSFSDGDGPHRSLKGTSDSPSFEDITTVQHTKKILQKKNQLHPLFANHPYRCGGLYATRVSSSRPKLKDVSQRIVSAKLLQIKELRNQLTLTQHQLNEVSNENRFLKTLQKRQEAALRKYEGSEARLPQLIQSHNEEVRILTAKLKQLKQTNQRLVEKLKVAENHLSNLQEQHCHLVNLSRNQQLGEREALSTQVCELQHSVRDQHNTIQLLTRKVDLERKNYKYELGIEKNKRNDVERKLALALQTIENLKDQIEAKEKCMSAIVPSRYVRTAQPTQPTSRFTHCQIPRTPLNVCDDSHNKIVNHTPRRSSTTDHTGDETDIGESQNGHNTSGTSRTLSGTTLPKIKPQITSKNLRNQYKLSSKRMVKVDNERITTGNTNTPDYSSSFTSEESCLKDITKKSECDLERTTQAKRQMAFSTHINSSRARKYSFDSGVINKSESGKLTQRTEQSRESSSKTRRNSISVCPTSAGEMDEYLQQESLAAKTESHKTIREELRELEQKLLQGSSFVEKSRRQQSVDVEVEESAKELCKGMVGTPRNGCSDRESDEDDVQDNLDDVSWNEIHNKIKAESDAAEAKLEEYYNVLEKSELSLEETENYIGLEEEQKERLLKALKEIDKEALVVSSGSSSDDVKPSLKKKPTRRKSDGYSYNFSKNIDNLHRGRPVYDKVKIPVIEKMRKEEKEYVSDTENGKKTKDDFMRELFGNLDDAELQNDNVIHPQRSNKERLVQLNRSFD